MHVAGVSLDLNLFLKFIFTAFVLVFGLLHLLKNTASKYFEVDGASFDNTDRSSMPGVIVTDSTCAVCGANSVKICSRCKAVRYCSETCQRKHWRSGHQKECNSTKTSDGRKNFKGIALVPTNKSTTKRFKHPKKILFPYDEFIELFHWGKPGFPPCGLLNCGNSCFANVVLQCLSSTRPLVAYLLEKGHRRECIREEWCFLCEFESHIERVSRSSHAFSPTNIISRLPNIGGNLGYGRQEDAHELMRFAIDTMQSVCLGEFGGEKAVQPSSQETTIIQHIFGGQLQSQVICTKCNNISNQYENMMDLTVEIHGDDSSLEECLDQFTVKEWLHGDNMYKCDGCNDYVKAWKRLTVKRAPNVLTIALKRFQSGRFGKINKRVTFPEHLDLSPYMSEAGDGTDIYSLYGVVVHVDMLNASYFGHYICYTKDFNGKWYKIDDREVTPVHLDEVLSQGAYMLLYSRVRARPSCMSILEPPRKEVKASAGVEPLANEPDKCSPIVSAVPTCHPGSEPSDISPPQQLSNYVEDSSAEPKHSDESTDVVHLRSPLSVEEVHIIENGKIDVQSSSFVTREISSCEKASAGALDLDMARGDLIGMDLANDDVCQEISQEASACCGKDLPSADDMDIDNWEQSTFAEDDIEIHRSNGATDASHEKATPVEHPKLPNGLPNGNGFHRLQQVNDDG